MLVKSLHFSNGSCFGRKILTGLCTLGIPAMRKAIKINVSIGGDT